MDFIARAQEVFSLEVEELVNVGKRIGNEMNEVVELIYNTKGKVVITGIGKTGIIGHKIASSLASTGTQAVFLNAAEALHGDLGVIQHGDVVIALSNSGSSQEILNIIAPIKKIGCSLVALTGNPKSPLAKEADIVLNAGVEKEACPLGLAPTTSTTAALLMGDALVVCLIDRRGFKAENFALYHPGGALGRRLLTRVKDLMRTDIPVVKDTTPFKDIIYEVSSKRLGMTTVQDSSNQSIGIITDGDIRRAIFKFDKEVMNVTAAAFMTAGFKRIPVSAMVTDALEMMDIYKIMNLAVVEKEDSDKVIGILAMHDIMEFRK
ncbi:MAG: KpsF/GutQ family sugar-phosphate isomerase [Prevotellaceae bacterium]|jgi:arabinose-5-phosphate isomerase|nr:KpsF/GutQ family sugar-phosphate isomerase [Prevotellaceae bacterium]